MNNKTDPKEENKCPMSWHGAKMDFSNDMSYGDYLGLDQILSAQHPRSPNHNEMLFIIQHQTSELWIKLILHELHAVREQIKLGELPPAFKMLSRVARIMDQLVHAWDVLATMTPSEYTAIRPYLGNSSGFQSHQYRELEFLLGNKNASMLDVHATKPEAHASLDAALNSPSIYDETIMFMARNGFDIEPSRLSLDWSNSVVSNDSVKRAWQKVYQAPEQHWLYYELAEKLVDMETAFRIWRFRHV
ncbi:MAG: tryptophan 2,3-dioxygenase family protein, partial [Undibacterium sp.]|nr:tryptophan 2,3-dioxygenase family protein [Undibacterium sp.]